jgi:hypothetical protein
MREGSLPPGVTYVSQRHPGHAIRCIPCLLGCNEYGAHGLGRNLGNGCQRIAPSVRGYELTLR